MTIRLLVREMSPDEIPMVLSNWKRQLDEDRKVTGWGRYMRPAEYWSLVNHVIDRITLPSCSILVGCHESAPDVPMCWIAIRNPPAPGIVYLYCRISAREDAELAASMQRELVTEARKAFPSLSDEWPRYNPYKELKR